MEYRTDEPIGQDGAVFDLIRLAAAVLILLAALSAAKQVRADGGMLLIGDSRAEGMHEVVGDAGISWCFRIGSGYNWMISDAFPAADASVTAGTSVVIALGVNDVVDSFRIQQYASAISRQAAVWKERGVRTYYVSILPVDDSLDSEEHNSDIEYWNRTIGPLLSEDVTYLDLYGRVLADYATTDGLHYTDDTYRKIFQLITEAVGSGDAGSTEGMRVTAADTETAGVNGNEGLRETESGDTVESPVSDTGSGKERAGRASSAPDSARHHEDGRAESRETSAEAITAAGDGEVFSVRVVPEEKSGSGYSGWLALNQGTCYLENGTPVTGWCVIGGSLYCFSDRGLMLTGEVTLQTGTYRFRSDGTLDAVLSGMRPVADGETGEGVSAAEETSESG